jgi:16S rRNA (cytosine967-C5)-methyltransferase
VQLHDNEESLGRLAGRFDRVLVDAPCTGTGTWRRRPDTKWRLTQRALEERVSQQADALDQAKRFVRPGGKLIYVTCSVLSEENDRQMAAFLAANPDFSLTSALADWQSLFGPNAPRPVSSDGNTLTLTPATTGTDGFFFASLVRNA